MFDVRATAQALLNEVDALIGESSGVIGLHLNGDPAPWGEVVAGGRFERLSSLEDLRTALAEDPAPVARVVAMEGTPSVRLEWASVEAAHNARPGPLYATADRPMAQPLPDERLAEILTTAYGTPEWSMDDVRAARAVEREVLQVNGLGGSNG